MPSFSSSLWVVLQLAQWSAPYTLDSFWSSYSEPFSNECYWVRLTINECSSLDEPCHWSETCQHNLFWHSAIFGSFSVCYFTNWWDRAQNGKWSINSSKLLSNLSDFLFNDWLLQLLCMCRASVPLQGSMDIFTWDKILGMCNP